MTERDSKKNQIEDLIDNMNRQDFMPETLSFQKSSWRESSINQVDDMEEEKEEGEFHTFVGHFKKSWYYFFLIVYRFLFSFLNSFFAGSYQVILVFLELIGHFCQGVSLLLNPVL